MLDPDILVQDVSDLTAYTGLARNSVPTQDLGKDDFLRMLITQLRYQDPMDPMKDQEFIAQMAQFSSLEQMVNMNRNLAENLNWNYLLSQTINNTMATSLIGREIKAVGSELYLPDDGGAKLHYRLEAYAQRVSIDILDGSGTTVATYTQDGVGAGNQSFEWDGKTINGDRSGPGTYSFRVRATDQNGNSIMLTPYRIGLVDGVQYLDGQAYLVIDGVRVSLGDVIEVGVGGNDG